MIIANLVGGLGNQMFQYAAGRALSLERGVPLRLDVGEFSKHSIHQGFELGRVFAAPVALAGPAELYEILGWRSFRPALRVLSRPGARFIRGNSLVVEPYYHYFAGIRLVSSSCYLKGYWQSERYFSASSDSIRDDFTFCLPMSAENEQAAIDISSVKAVSLHVRRGDYVRDPQTLSVHGVCSLEYYGRAVRYIAERVADPMFFVFSDDTDWVRRHLQINHPCRYIDNNRGQESYNDMRLMSLCKHHIIANSSFGWWGAWLNSNPEKIVVAPARWFADGSRCLDDLFPEGWVKL